MMIERFELEKIFEKTLEKLRYVDIKTNITSRVQYTARMIN